MVQIVPITTEVVSWNPVQGEVNSTTLGGKVFQCLATSRWFSPGTPVSSTNKTERHDITELLLKVALNTITIADYKQLHKSNINKANNHLSSQTIEHKKTTTYDVRNPDPGLR